MRRNPLAYPAPSNAEVYKRLKWIIYSNVFSKKLCLRFWLGRSEKPTAYNFPSMEALEQYLGTLKVAEDKTEKHKEEHKAARQVRANEMREKIKEGTLLHYSWGYDQTNCEFYQVVERKGATIKMRPIAGQQVGEEGMHAMSCHYKPVRDSFVGDEVITKRIGPYGIAMDFGTASITREDEKHYCSWYG